jgi:hypothetical protein
VSRSGVFDIELIILNIIVNNACAYSQGEIGVSA